MSAMQRKKAGEREAAELVRELTGWDVRRRVRQHAGDSNLQGVPGWAVEVKRHRTAQAGEVADGGCRQSPRPATCCWCCCTAPTVPSGAQCDRWPCCWCTRPPTRGAEPNGRQTRPFKRGPPWRGRCCLACSAC